MNIPSSFPVQGYRGNAEVNYQVRAWNNKKKFPVLSTTKIPVRIFQAIRGFDYWKNFPVGLFTISKVSGSRVVLEALP